MSEKPSLLLIPGVLCTDALWNKSLFGLGDRFDIHFPPVLDQSTTHDMAVAVLEVAAKGSVVIGFSLGGWVALEMMRIRSDFFSGLVLVSTTEGHLPDSTKDAMRAAI